MRFQETQFFKQTNLMLECLSVVSSEKEFALKGGTAINLFYAEVPRLSVDIDLVYLPNVSYEDAQNRIETALNRIADKLESIYPKSSVLRSKNKTSGSVAKLIFQMNRLSVVIEPNLVLRGSIEMPKEIELSSKAKELFSKELYIQSLTKHEIFAGKFCAALDRQHPRDLFDVDQFFRTEIIDESLKNLFMVYLLSSGRPIQEVLFPTQKDITVSYKNEFEAMTETPVPLSVLLKARNKLTAEIHSKLTANDKEFLKSFASGEPKWDLFPIKSAVDFSGITWKLKNVAVLKETNPTKLELQLSELTNKLASI